MISKQQDVKVRGAKKCSAGERICFCFRREIESLNLYQNMVNLYVPSATPISLNKMAFSVTSCLTRVYILPVFLARQAGS
jgi:hypothetical protein